MIGLMLVLALVQAPADQVQQASGKIVRIAIVHETTLWEQPDGGETGIALHSHSSTWLEVGLKGADGKLRHVKFLDPDGKVFARGRRGLTELKPGNVGVGRQATALGKFGPAESGTDPKLRAVVWDKLVVDVE